MHPRRFLRDSIVYAAAQYVYRLLLMARGLISARLLGPQSYGAWNAIQLVMDYGLLATAGTFQGLDQTVPPRIVDGDEAALERTKSAGLFNVLVLSLLYSIGVLVYFVSSNGKIESFWGMQGIAVAVGCVVLINLSYFLLNLLRAHNNIPAVSGWYLVQGVIGAGLALAFVGRFGVWALLGGWFVGTLAATAVTAWQARAIVPRAARASEESVALLQIGLPMFLYSGAMFVMRTLDRVIILKFLGTLALGYYSLGVTGVTLLLYLPESVSFVIYPQLLRQYREAGDRVEGIRPRVERTLQALSILVPVLCGLAYLLARDLIGGILPKFLPGLEAIRIVCVGSGGLAFLSISAIVLMTLRRQAYLVPAALLGALLGAALDLIAARAGTGITGIAWATLIAYVINGIVMLGLAGVALRGTARGATGLIVRSFLPLGLSFAIAWLLDRVLPGADAGTWGGRLVHMGLATVSFLPAYAVVAYPFGRGAGLKQMLSEIRPAWMKRSSANDA
jgi:O-antigen/teichoic acid export membrane protein